MTARGYEKSDRDSSVRPGDATITTIIVYNAIVLAGAAAACWLALPFIRVWLGR